MRLSTYRVRIERHTVAGRWLILGEAFTLLAVDESHAARQAVQLVHAAAAVAPWKPFARASLLYTTAEPVGSQNVTPLRRDSQTGQLELFDRLAA